MNKNQLRAEDQAIHNWYRFVLAYPPHLVREYLEKLGADPERDWIYDPFSGTATTPLEARLNGFPVVASDANHISVLASHVKLCWDIDLGKLQESVEQVLYCAYEYTQQIHLQPLAWTENKRQLPLFEEPVSFNYEQTSKALESELGVYDPAIYLTDDLRKILPKNFISEKPLKRILAIRHAIKLINPPYSIANFLNLALANTILSDASNIAFGPEIYAKKPKEDADVLNAYHQTVLDMIADLEKVVSRIETPYPPAYIFQNDARKLSALSELPQIGMVITSPPYPNEKDYTRTTRLENVLLGYITSKNDLRSLKNHLLRSNTRNVFVSDDDDQFIKDIPTIVRLADKIEEKRIKLGKTSGFEKLYHRVTSLYFGGMYRHLMQLHQYLRPGARCAYVVGDQRSFFRILIPTAKLLADVALKAGYEVEGIENWRNRFSTVTKTDIEENVLIIRKPIGKNGPKPI